MQMNESAPPRIRSTFLTWSIAENSQLWFLCCQNPEHHISGSLAGAVQHPGAKGLLGTQGGEVDHGPLHPWTLWKSLEDASSQTETGADVERHVRVHIVPAGKGPCIAGHVSQRGCEDREELFSYSDHRVFPKLEKKKKRTQKEDTKEGVRTSNARSLQTLKLH